MATNGTVDNVAKILCDNLCMHPNHCGRPSCPVKCRKWDVTQITMTKILSSIKYGILILNRPITQNQDFIKTLWNKAAVRMTVDGGTTQWDKFLSSLPDDMKKTLKDPDLVSGDFDSISDKILEKYKKKGCKIVHTPDQMYTDFTKALMVVHSHSKQIGVELTHIVAIAQTSGRPDHILGNIQTLFLVEEKFLLHPNTSVYLMSDDSISWLLQPGIHVIYVPEQTRQHKRAWCSLIPIGASCEYVTTTGLKWNLDNQQLRFGELVSTSNTFDGSERVTVKCSHTLMWSMKVPSIAAS